MQKMNFQKELQKNHTKSYFDVTIENDKIISLKLNEQTTTSEQQKSDELMAKLRSKSKGSKYKKN
jgi:hypothetical protein